MDQKSEGVFSKDNLYSESVASNYARLRTLLMYQTIAEKFSEENVKQLFKPDNPIAGRYNQEIFDLLKANKLDQAVQSLNVFEKSLIVEKESGRLEQMNYSLLHDDDGDVIAKLTKANHKLFNNAFKTLSDTDTNLLIAATGFQSKKSDDQLAPVKVLAAHGDDVTRANIITALSEDISIKPQQSERSNSNEEGEYLPRGKVGAGVNFHENNATYAIAHTLSKIDDPKVLSSQIEALQDQNKLASVINASFDKQKLFANPDFERYEEGEKRAEAIPPFTVQDGQKPSVIVLKNAHEYQQIVDKVKDNGSPKAVAAILSNTIAQVQEQTVNNNPSEGEGRSHVLDSFKNLMDGRVFKGQINNNTNEVFQNMNQTQVRDLVKLVAGDQVFTTKEAKENWFKEIAPKLDDKQRASVFEAVSALSADIRSGETSVSDTKNTLKTLGQGQAHLFNSEAKGNNNQNAQSVVGMVDHLKISFDNENANSNDNKNNITPKIAFNAIKQYTMNRLESVEPKTNDEIRDLQTRRKDLEKQTTVGVENILKELSNSFTQKHLVAYEKNNENKDNQKGIQNNFDLGAAAITDAVADFAARDKKALAKFVGKAEEALKTLIPDKLSALITVATDSQKDEYQKRADEKHNTEADNAQARLNMNSKSVENQDQSERNETLQTYLNIKGMIKALSEESGYGSKQPITKRKTESHLSLQSQQEQATQENLNKKRSLTFDPTSNQGVQPITNATEPLFNPKGTRGFNVLNLSPHESPKMPSAANPSAANPAVGTQESLKPMSTTSEPKELAPVHHAILWADSIKVGQASQSATQNRSA